MSYSLLNSPLPGLTVSQNGDRCCGMRGLGDDPPVFDTSPTSVPGDLIDPNVITPDLPLAPSDTIGPSIDAMYPQSVGTEFISNGDGTYTNIQTGQSVPYSIAQQVTAATTGSGTANVQTQSATVTGTIVDPNTGATISTNNLSTAAQALNAAGQLVTAAGKLTAQGQALLNTGNLYNAPPATGISAAMSSLTSWFTGSTLIAGVPNVAILAVVAGAVLILPSMMSGKKRRR